MNIVDQYNKRIYVAKCENSMCGYIGNKGLWKGTKEINGQEETLEGIVTLQDDGTWNLDDIISEEENEIIGEIDGCSCCPMCGSFNFD